MVLMISFPLSLLLLRQVVEMTRGTLQTSEHLLSTYLLVLDNIIQTSVTD